MKGLIFKMEQTS